MNHQMIGYVIGHILLTESVLMLLPLITGLFCGESPVPFIIPMLLLAVVGGVLGLRKPKKSALFARDGFAVVALAWIAMSAFGALPFVISGDIPHYVDALFETVSGFTTTGATVLSDIEAMSRGCMMWRSTYWSNRSPLIFSITMRIVIY